ncbi:DUF2322 family protein [Thioalkalivibrio sulfidiphilus]|uniref:DUF2322 family protein n=1 Tax=Thioalkalivibrio sulfidiphilus TaxID=1033854 RepID=UPI00037312B2|nr:DUF2322 family protein [Thioalkalivibrio sulfidiphilus]
MASFQDNLKQLPSIDHIARLELYGDGYEPEASIENKPGSQGSLAVYYKVSLDHGGLTPNAARDALGLFAEHVQDAHDHPGKHPNIDRLFKVIDEDLYYSVKAVPKV